MNKIQNLLSSENGLFKTIKRFPVSCLLCVFLFYLSFNTINKKTLQITPEQFNFLVAGVFWFISLKLFTESSKLNKKWTIFLSGSIIFFACFTFTNFFRPTEFIITSSFLSLFIAPYMGNSFSQNSFWFYSYKFVLNILITSIISIILTILTFIMIYALESLFNMKINFYLINVGLFIILCFAPILAMTSIPGNFEIEIKKYPRALSNLLSFVFIPVFAIYTIIIYLYIGKIFIEKSLPSNTIGYLISIYGIISMLIYFSIYPVDEKTGIIYFYIKHFHKFLILPLILLAFAIYLRIKQHGITISRYLILLNLIWITISTIFLFSKYKNNAPSFILKTLILLVFLSTFGPLGATNISLKSQQNVLVSLLKKNKILINEKINKMQAGIDIQDLCQINSAIEYIIPIDKTKRLLACYLIKKIIS